MSRIQEYSGALTREQFLFYEIRIAAKLYLAGTELKAAIAQIKDENLFQFPTEREIASMVRVCYKRIKALENDSLITALVEAPAAIAKQVNLYAIMRSNGLVWDFMSQVVGEKYLNQDFAYERKDLNIFFSRLQAQNDIVAAWSDSTITKIKSVLTRMLVEAEYLDSFRDTTLHQIYLSEELEAGIRANGDLDILPAFNCFL
ncbi:MAG: DUF1819 family protein [Ruminococcaceae bacterium]|nr:DUF1819 family protein [Oscillospiraceae bacterium]